MLKFIASQDWKKQRRHRERGRKNAHSGIPQSLFILFIPRRLAASASPPLRRPCASLPPRARPSRSAPRGRSETHGCAQHPPISFSTKQHRQTGFSCTTNERNAGRDFSISVSIRTNVGPRVATSRARSAAARTRGDARRHTHTRDQDASGSRACVRRERRISSSTLRSLARVCLPRFLSFAARPAVFHFLSARFWRSR